MLDIRPTNNWRYASNRMEDIKPSAGLKKRLTFEEPEEETNNSSDTVPTDYLDQQLGEIQKADRLRWNYDFKRDQPLPGGRYKWERDAPRCTTQRQVDDGEGSCCESTCRSSESESESSCLDSPTSSTSSPAPRSLSFGHAVAASPSTQRSLSEFFRQKKRPSPSTKGDELRAKRARICRNASDGDNCHPPRSLFHPISKPESKE